MIRKETQMFLRSIALIWMSSSILHSVNCQQEIKTSVGADVLLPCVSTPTKENVFWRTTGDADVYNIIKGTADLTTQSSKFKDRVSTFPHLYKKGNFSILLKGASLNDIGEYTCHIPGDEFRQTVKLDVSAAKTTTAGNGGSAAVTSGPLHLLLLQVLVATVQCLM
ncbi:CD276 antigen homolog [Genypterus blacodes]|uniref:CD276 antigen homolog n=1 Tax=Genypterus blacodes TaxID=154954 RepID=UPI003F7603CF